MNNQHQYLQNRQAYGVKKWCPSHIRSFITFSCPLQTALELITVRAACRLYVFSRLLVFSISVVFYLNAQTGEEVFSICLHACLCCVELSGQLCMTKEDLSGQMLLCWRTEILSLGLTMMELDFKLNLMKPLMFLRMICNKITYQLREFLFIAL